MDNEVREIASCVKTLLKIKGYKKSLKEITKLIGSVGDNNPVLLCQSIIENDLKTNNIISPIRLQILNYYMKQKLLCLNWDDMSKKEKYLWAYRLYQERVWLLFSNISKSNKDMVAAECEGMRWFVWTEIWGGTPNRSFQGDSQDILIRIGDIEVLEEVKGHYIDKCFYGRAVLNTKESLVRRSLNGYSIIPIFTLFAPAFPKALSQWRCDEVSSYLYNTEIYTKMAIDNLKIFSIFDRDRVRKEEYCQHSGWLNEYLSVDKVVEEIEYIKNSLGANNDL